MITSRLDCGLEIKCYLNRALRKLEKRGRCMDEGGEKRRSQGRTGLGKETCKIKSSREQVGSFNLIGM